MTVPTERECSYTNEPVCPYCNHVQGDFWEMRGEDGDCVCGNCDRLFMWSRYVEVSYSTKPIIGPHRQATPDFMAMTFPGKTWFEITHEVDRLVKHDKNIQRLANDSHPHSKFDEALAAAVPMLLFCPMCQTKHIDEGEFAAKPHHTHACQGWVNGPSDGRSQRRRCGHVWRPAIVPTVGVETLPGFLNDPAPQKIICLSDELHLGNVGSSCRVDLKLGISQRMMLTRDCEITLVDGQNETVYELRIDQDHNGGHVAKFTNLAAAGGRMPVVPTGGGEFVVLEFQCANGNFFLLNKRIP